MQKTYYNLNEFWFLKHLQTCISSLFSDLSDLCFLECLFTYILMLVSINVFMAFFLIDSWKWWAQVDLPMDMEMMTTTTTITITEYSCQFAYRIKSDNTSTGWGILSQFFRFQNFIYYGTFVGSVGLSRRNILTCFSSMISGL